MPHGLCTGDMTNHRDTVENASQPTLLQGPLTRSLHSSFHVAVVFSLHKLSAVLTPPPAFVLVQLPVRLQKHQSQA